MVGLTDMKVLSSQGYEMMSEMLAQYLEDFNTATAGAFVMSSARTAGDREVIADFKRIANLAKRRKAYDDSTAISSTKIEQREKVAVKVGGRTDEILFTKNQFTWLQLNPDEADSLISQQLAQAMFQDMVNTSLASTRAAMVQNGSAVGYTVPSNGEASLSALVSGAAKFGDRAQDVKVWVTHSKPIFDIYQTALTNSSQLFNIGNVQVQQDGFGRRFVITDSPALATGSPLDYYMLGLTDGAITVKDEGTFDENLVRSNGVENIQNSYQAQWDYTLALKGYSFSKSIASPTDAQLITGSNWTKYAESDKFTAGVYVKAR